MKIARPSSYSDFRSLWRAVSLPYEFEKWRDVLDFSVWEAINNHRRVSYFHADCTFNYVNEFLELARIDKDFDFNRSTQDKIWMCLESLDRLVQAKFPGLDILPQFAQSKAVLPQDFKETVLLTAKIASFKGLSFDAEAITDVGSWMSVIAQILVPVIIDQIRSPTIMEARRINGILAPLVAKIQPKLVRPRVLQLGRRLHNVYASMNLLKGKCDFHMPDTWSYDLNVGHALEAIPMQGVVEQLARYAMKAAEFTNWLIEAVAEHYSLVGHKPVAVEGKLFGSMEDVMDEIERMMDEMESSLRPVENALTVGKMGDVAVEGKASALLTDMQTICGVLQTLRSAIVQKKGRVIPDLKLRGKPPAYRAMGWADEVSVFIDDNWDLIMTFAGLIAQALGMEFTLPPNSDRKDPLGRQRHVARGLAGLSASIPKLVRQARSLGVEVGEDTVPSFYVWPSDKDGSQGEFVPVAEYKHFVERGYEPLKRLIVGDLKLDEVQHRNALVAEIAEARSMVDAQKDKIASADKRIGDVEKFVGSDDLQPRVVGTLSARLTALSQQVTDVHGLVLGFNNSLSSATSQWQNAIVDLNRQLQQIPPLVGKVAALEQKGVGADFSDLKQRLERIEMVAAAMTAVPGEVERLAGQVVKKYEFSSLQQEVSQLQQKFNNFSDADLLGRFENVRRRLDKVEKFDFETLSRQVRELVGDFQKIDIDKVRAVIEKLALVAERAPELEKMVKEYPHLRSLIAKCVQYINQWGRDKQFSDVEPIDSTALNFSIGQMEFAVEKSVEEECDRGGGRSGHDVEECVRVRVNVRQGSIPNRAGLSEYLGYAVGRGRKWLTWAECWFLAVLGVLTETWEQCKHPSRDFTGPWDEHRAAYEHHQGRIVTREELHTLGQARDIVSDVQLDRGPSGVGGNEGRQGDSSEPPALTGTEEVFREIGDVLDFVDHREVVLSSLHPSVCVIEAGRQRHELSSVRTSALWGFMMKDLIKGKGPFARLLPNFGMIPGSLEVMIRYNLSPLCGVGLALVYMETRPATSGLTGTEIYSYPHRVWNPGCEDSVIFRFQVHACSRFFNPNSLAAHAGGVYLVQLSNWCAAPSVDVHFTYSLSYSYDADAAVDIVRPLHLPRMLDFRQYIGSLDFPANGIASLRKVELNCAKPAISTQGLTYNRWQSLVGQFCYWKGDIIFEFVRCSSSVVSVTLGIGLCVGTRALEVSPESLVRLPHVELTFATKESRRFVRFPQHLMGFHSCGDTMNMLQGPIYTKPLTLIIWVLDAPSSVAGQPFVMDVAIARLENLSVYGQYAGQTPYGARTILKYVDGFPASVNSFSSTTVTHACPELLYQNVNMTVGTNDVNLMASNGQSAEVWNHVFSWCDQLGSTSASKVQFVLDAFKPNLQSVEKEVRGSLIWTPFVRVLHSSVWFKGTVKYRFCWVGKPEITNANWKGSVSVAVHGESVLTPRGSYQVSAERAGSMEFAVNIVGPVEGFYYLEGCTETELSPSMISIVLHNPTQYDHCELYGCFSEDCVSSGVSTLVLGKKLARSRDWTFTVM